MKRITVHLFAFILEPLRYLSGALALIMLMAVAVAQQVNPFDNNVFAFFSDPILFATTVAGVAGWLTELITDALKDRNFKLRGWHTRLVAAGVAAVLAGGGGYFGLSYFTGLSGWMGAFTAAHMALAAWLFSDVKHRAGNLRRKGQRKEVREQVAFDDTLVETVVDPVLTGLLREAAKLPPPFSIPVMVLTALYESAGAEAVINAIRGQRALSEAEKSVNQDDWEEKQDKSPTMKPARPNPPSAFNPSPSEG